MKKLLKSAPVLTLFALSFAACSGGASVEDFCAKEAECGLLDGNQTEQQCVTEGNQEFEALRNNPDCSAVVDALQGLIDCSSPLSCADLKSQATLQKECGDEVAAFQAVLTSPGKCTAFGTGQGNECNAAADCPQISCPNGGSGRGCINGTCAKEADLCGS